MDIHQYKWYASISCDTDRWNKKNYRIMNTDKSIIQQEKELSEYLTEWANTYYSKWSPFYHETNRNKNIFRGQLSYANELLNLLDSLMGNLEGYFELPVGGHLIPSSFSSIEQVMGWMAWMKKYIETFFPYIEENYKRIGSNYYIENIHQMMVGYTTVIERCTKVYSLESGLPIPYHKLRAYLINGLVDEFIEQLKYLLADIPYAIRKEMYNEAHFHISVHTLLSVLGFFPLSEKITSLGRIDMAISVDNVTYIFEFKYSKKKSMASTALKQIKDMKYADSYKLSSTKIVGVGVSFTEAKKNILNHVSEVLYEEPINRY